MMNKIMLASWGLQTPMGYDLISDRLLREDCEGTSILLISALSQEQNERLIDACVSLGFSREKVVLYKEGITDLESKFYDTIYVGEGNTFELLDYLKRSGLDQWIRDQFGKGARYIGISAGAHVAGLDIKAAIPFDENNVDLENLEALGLYDGVVIPHYSPRDVQRYEACRKAENSNKYGYVVPLGDDEIEVMSDGFIEDVRIRAFELALKQLEHTMMESLKEEKPQTFRVQTETGEIMEAELLFVMGVRQKEYALYTLDNGNGTYDVLASRVLQDEEGYDYLVNITDEKDKIVLTQYIRDSLKEKLGC